MGQRAFLSASTTGFDSPRWKAIRHDGAALSSVMRYTATDGLPYYAGGTLLAKAPTWGECAAKLAVREAQGILATHEEAPREHPEGFYVRPGDACYSDRTQGPVFVAEAHDALVDALGEWLK